jgi:hypothetical protein
LKGFPSLPSRSLLGIEGACLAGVAVWHGGPSAPQRGETGALLDAAEAQADIGLACLMANDLPLSFVPAKADSTLERLASILPFSDYIARDQYAFEIARSQEMFDNISQLPSIKG